jgi:hypothetical protein
LVLLNHLAPLVSNTPDEDVLISFVEEDISWSPYQGITERLDGVRRAFGGGLSGIEWYGEAIEYLSGRGRCFATSWSTGESEPGKENEAK